jgi:hypothetical protein
MMEQGDAAEAADDGAGKREVRADDTAHWLRYFGVGPEDD